MQRVECALDLKFAGGDDGERAFSGYGAAFGNVDSYGDVIAPGAFRDSIAEARKSGDWPAMLLQHGFADGGPTPIGVWTEMREDDRGLWVEGRLADTQAGRDSYALLKMQPRPAISGLSIGFVAKEWVARSKPEEPRRTLKRIDLFEVSLVTFPANRRAKVEAVKSERTIKDAERALRDAGFSRKEAAAIVAVGFRAAGLRDADQEAELRATLGRALSLFGATTTK